MFTRFMINKNRRRKRHKNRRRNNGLISGRKFYSLVFTLVICTFIVIGTLCALAIFSDQFKGNQEPAEQVVEEEKQNPIIELLHSKEATTEEPIDEVEEPEEEEISAKDCKIWPIKELELYKENPSSGGSKSKDNVITKIKGGTSLTVMEEEGDYFKVSFEGDEGYVESNFCMINLPDFLGDLLEYNITNSYSSVFMAHDYKLYEITGEVIPGFENVMIREGVYLVPFLYPCAVKLKPIAERVIEDGYKLKIYEAYRPHKATRFLYDTVNSYLYKHVPLRDENGDEIVEFDEEGKVILKDSFTYPPVNSLVTIDGSLILNDMVTVIAPAGSASMFPAGAMVIDNGVVIDAVGNSLGTIRVNTDGSLMCVVGEEGVEHGETIETEDAYDSEEENPANSIEAYGTETYSDVITGGRYRLGAFLAAVGSAHNKGIALDLTLCDKDTKEDLKMQTEIHDLSFNSVTGANNENAKLLAKYMMEGGFNDLVSEWWHFQDDETRKAIGANYSLEEGISP